MEQQRKFGDLEMLADTLFSQKYMTFSYDVGVNECTDARVMNELMNILHEEHQMQHAAMEELKKRGWGSHGAQLQQPS